MSMTTEQAITSLQNIVDYWDMRPTEQEAARLGIAALLALREQEEPKPINYRTLGGKRGQPVWMQIPDDRLWQSRWLLVGNAIQSQDGTDIGVFLGGFGNEAAFYFKDYGETWLLYSHPPKGDDAHLPIYGDYDRPPKEDADAEADT